MSEKSVHTSTTEATDFEQPSFLSASVLQPVDVRGFKIQCAAAIPTTPHLVYATNAPELIYPPDTRVPLESAVKGVATVRYVALDQRRLPEQRTVILVLLEGHGLRLFEWPSLKPIDNHDDNNDNNKSNEKRNVDDDKKKSDDKKDVTVADKSKSADKKSFDKNDRRLSKDEKQPPPPPEGIQALHVLSKNAHTFSVDSLGSDVVSESFRVAFASHDSVYLLDVNIPRAKVIVLGQYGQSISSSTSSLSISNQQSSASQSSSSSVPSNDQKVVAVAFSEMTIVASTPRLHYMLRISRGGGLAVAATVPRFERLRRSSGGESAAAGVVSFLGGLFTRRNVTVNITPVLAHALPENRWLLTVDDELITYSSFGAKLEDMENVFKSKVGMQATDIAPSTNITVRPGINANPASITKQSSSYASETQTVASRSQFGGAGGAPSGRSGTTVIGRPGMVKSMSNSSLGSVATTMSYMTYLDQSSAIRAEKPPAVTAFSSPFVMSVTADNELMAFAANGSIPGVIDRLILLESILDHEEKNKNEISDSQNRKSSTASTNSDTTTLTPEQKEQQRKQQLQQLQQQLTGVRLVTCRHDLTLAVAFWPNGTVIAINLNDDLESLTERHERQNQLRFALALVPSDQTDRMLTLRRQLAAEARSSDWHDAAMHHMQVVVNLSVRMDGVYQVDLVSEAVELRGAIGTSWHSDLDTATMWADFLYRLRRRIMRPGPADVDVLHTLCFADESAVRIKSLLSVKHDISLTAGEALITSKDCMLREEERVEALVALYNSLSEHGKALVLLENTQLTNSFDGVLGYLGSSMHVTDNPDVFFHHLKWLAHRSKQEAQGKTKLDRLVRGILADCGDVDMTTSQQSTSNALSSRPNFVGDIDMTMSRIMEILVEEVDDLAIEIVDEVAPSVASTNSSNPSQPPSGLTSTESSSKKKSKEETKKSSTPTMASTQTKLEVSADATAAGLLAGMSRANAMSKTEVFEKLRQLFNDRILHNVDASYHAYTLLQALQTARYKALGLHEEQAHLLGQQGRHEAAADELAAEKSLDADEALLQLTRMLPASDKASAAESLVGAYLRVSAQGRAMRVAEAAEIIRCSAGTIDMEKILLDGRCADDALSLTDMWPLLRQGIISATNRLRIAECLRAMRRSEMSRMREEVLMRRRRFVVVGHDKACTLCTRRIGESVFAAYPDGSIAHLACHMSRDKG